MHPLLDQTLDWSLWIILMDVFSEDREHVEEWEWVLWSDEKWWWVDAPKNASYGGVWHEDPNEVTVIETKK